MIRLKLPEFEKKLLQEVLNSELLKQDDEVWLVGGSIRDLANGARTVPDLDLAVSFDPMPLARDYARRKKAGFVVLDEERQVVRIVKSCEQGHYNVDIARFRAENIDADLRARDFTINAMAARIKLPFTGEELEIHDPLDGYSHLQQRLVIPCSNDLFVDDPLRIMRAFRFAALFESKFSNDLQALIVAQAHLLKEVSGERIRDELFKVFSTCHSSQWLELMQSTGVLPIFLPELANCLGVEQNEWHHLDVFEHTLLTLANLESHQPPHPYPDWWPLLQKYLEEPISAGRSYWQCLKLGCLLHDLGKPACKKENSDNGKVIFHGHEMEGVRMCREICERLKLSVNELHFLQKVVKNHMRPGVMLQQGISDKRLFKYYSETGRDGVAIALLSLADRRSAMGTLSENDLREFSAGIYSIIDKFYQEMKKPKAAVLLSGADLIEEFHLKPGPRFKELLEAVAEAQFTGEIQTRDEALALIKKLIDLK